VSLALEVSVKDFYEVEHKFVENLAFVLSIPRDRIFVVSVVAATGRRLSAAGAGDGGGATVLTDATDTGGVASGLRPDGRRLSATGVSVDVQVH
jgi:hypothetical protein